MEHRHLTADEPEWLAILGRLNHDFYHRPEYCRLDGEPQQAETGAFWAGEGDRELFHRPGGNRGHGLVSR